MIPTPLPWYTDNYGRCIYDSHGNVVCEMHGSYQHEDKKIDEQCKVDADFILSKLEE